jgi:ubiquinone biosynthesis protein
MQFPFWIAFVITVTIGIGGFVWATRGLLGMRFTTTRLLLAGIVSLSCFTPIMNAMVDPDEFQGTGLYPGLWFFLLGMSLAIVCGMTFLVIAEALVPSNVLPGPRYMIRAVRRWRSRASRYWEITRIIIRNGLTAYIGGGRRAELHSSDGRRELASRLRVALNQGGVTFIKLGQIMSTRRDLLPPEFVEELSELQDQAARVPWEQVEQILRQDLRGDLTDHFLAFDREPIAAASIAQVHTARLHTGEDLVVKVRRPDIVSQVERDLDVVERLAKTIERRTVWGNRIGIVALANGFAIALREELDLRVEARNITVVDAATRRRKDDTGLSVPRLYPELCSQRVLVMERIDGIPLSDARHAIVERNLDPHKLASTLLDSLLRQIVIDGTFHADPHPGNVMLTSGDRLTLLDFGSVGRMDSMLRTALLRLIMTFDQGDPIAATDALLELVERPEHLDETRLERTVGQFMARHLAPGLGPDMMMIPDLFRIIADFGLSVPPEVAAAFRAIATLDGTLTNIAPGFNMVEEARAFAASYLNEQLRPSAIRKTLTAELFSLLPMIRRMPRRMDRIAAALEEGRLNVNVRPLAHEGDREVVGGMLHDVILAMLACTAGIMAALLIGQDGGPAVTDTVSMYQFIGYALLVAAMILALRVLAIVFRRSSQR